MIEMTEQVAFTWACGLFDGEGSISQKQEDNQRSVRMNVTSTDLDLLERFLHIVKCGYIVECRRGASFGLDYTELGYKMCWKWVLCKWSDIEPLIKRMQPFMSTRRAEKIQQVLDDPPTGGSIKRTHCKRGHPLTEDNLYHSRRGDRQCRTCTLENAKRRYKERNTFAAIQ